MSACRSEKASTRRDCWSAARSGRRHSRTARGSWHPDRICRASGCGRHIRAVSASTRRDSGSPGGHPPACRRRTARTRAGHRAHRSVRASGCGRHIRACHVVEERRWCSDAVDVPLDLHTLPFEPIDLVGPVAEQRHRAVRENAADGAPTQDVPLDPEDGKVGGLGPGQPLVVGLDVQRADVERTSSRSIIFPSSRHQTDRFANPRSWSSRC